jgi:hypothetical protein
LKALDITESSIPLELLQITLKNFPLLKSLRLKVDGCNFSSADYNPDYSFGEYLNYYEKEQAEKTAQLIGENYDRFEHIMLTLCDGGEHIINYLQKHYPNVRIEQRTQDEIWNEKSLKASEKSLKIVILLS